MSTVVTIRGVPINFPFEPYDLQKEYMEKVLECLQNETNGVLESPTGTGKTLSLLCSTLAWLELKKAQIQAQRQIANLDENNFLQLNGDLSSAVGDNPKYRALSGAPVIIYSSRTHSQLSQAAKELKRTSYKHMKACVIGSRDQLCINPDVVKEQNKNLKMQMCQLKVQTRSCHYFNRVESKKMDPAIRDVDVMDIEDLVTLGGSHKFCPYYMVNELKQQADIIFMPYNYLLDPMVRKNLGIELANHVIIFDEAHNVEKICEQSASTQLKSSDIALAIEDVTTIMKMMSDDVQIFEETPKDFNAEDLCTLKQILLDLEKEIDNIDLKCGPEGATKQASFLFDLFAKAGITLDNSLKIAGLIMLITQYLATVGDGPFARRGIGLQTFEEVLRIVYFSNTFSEKVARCYKVHIEEEEVKKNKAGNWLSKATANSGGKKINYWCFSPGFGMNMLLSNGLRCMILTSGTLAPLRPLISELELDVPVRLENPHIVKKDQVIVKIIPVGPDSEILNCNYQNRDNPKYINSLGRAILNLTRVIPAGLLIFFPSYPIMLKCQQYWQESGVWGSIITQKNIYVEPRDKESFHNAMHDYYEKIRDPSLKGAIFMGVCRGKVSEGLDFADANGRAVIVTGLPYPPMRDPRVILKKQYLDVCNSKDKEFLKGDDWYSLEASRAVNQAIGRVIRHKNDYGAILLLDTRFNNPRIKNQMSLWLRDRITVAGNFGASMRDIKLFFRNANDKFQALPEPNIHKVLSAELNTLPTYKSGYFDFSSSSLPTKSTLFNDGEVLVHKVGKDKNPPKRMKITLIDNRPKEDNSLHTSVKEYILMIKKKLDEPSFKSFTAATKIYKDNNNIDEFISLIDALFRNKAHLRYLIHGLENFIKPVHQAALREYCDKNV